MSIEGITCYLRCVKDNQKKISLPHSKSVFIGRNEESGITDLSISRNHLECIADYTVRKVTLKTLGKSLSGCNGYALLRDQEYCLQHGDRIEVKLGCHEYDIIFESTDDDKVEPKAKKPKIDFFNLAGGSSSKFSDTGSWEEIDKKALLIYTSEGCKPQSSIAAFDLDGTLTKTKSGNKFPKDNDDWVLNYNNIPQKLQQLHDNNHKIVIFTNQSGLRDDANKIKGFKKKIENIIKAVGVPMQVFIATGISIYRKPAPGMWNTLCDVTNGDAAIDYDTSFYVGDAAGRDKKSKKSKDHSISDRLFALNINIKFYTPEEYFSKSSPAQYAMPEFDPRNIPVATLPDLTTTDQEIIIMVGVQGSGKSHFCKTHLIPKGYAHISRDKLGTWQKCVKALEECIKKNESAVVDNTNPDKEARQKFIDVAKSHKVNCRCFVMDVTHKHARHNNRFRRFTDKSHTEINEMIMNSYKKNYQEPEMSEGYSEIVKIPFIPKFDDPKHEKLYKMFLLES